MHVQVAVVVKVTREVENQTLKCHRYWPDPDSQPPQKIVLIGQIEVEHMSTFAEDQWVVRVFRLRCGTQERQLTQFSYEAWPGVLNQTFELANWKYTTRKSTHWRGKPFVWLPVSDNSI